MSTSAHSSLQIEWKNAYAGGIISLCVCVCVCVCVYIKTLHIYMIFILSTIYNLY
jgi:hypothetical protein